MCNEGNWFMYDDDDDNLMTFLFKMITVTVTFIW